MCVLVWVIMWASSDAALGQVAILVNMESVFLPWDQSRESARDLRARE